MSEAQTPPDTAALLAASPEELSRWSRDVTLPEFDLDELSHEVLERQVGGALLASDFHVETPEEVGLWAELLAACRMLWPAVPAFALGLFVLISSQSLQRDALRAKGVPGRKVMKPQAKLYLLHSILGRGGPGTFLEPAATLFTHQSFSIGFQLQPPGGFVALLWHRGHAAPALLYRTRRAYKPGRIAYLLRGKEVVKFPLGGELPGRVCLQLIQSRKPLQRHQLRHLPALPRGLRRQGRPTPGPVPRLSILATARFCFVIAQGGRPAHRGARP